MKKDYSKRNLINSFGMNLPNNIGLLVSILISIPFILIFNNSMLCMLILGFIHSFIGLPIAGKLLDKYCNNIDIEKCRKCKNWNCTRNIKNENDI